MATAVEVRALLNEALNEFDKPSMTVSACVRRAHRIATLRHDLLNLLWLQWELTDLTAGGKDHVWQDPGVAGVKAQLNALLGAEDGRKAALVAFHRWERNRTSGTAGEERVLTPSIGQIELQLTSMRDTYSQSDSTNLEGGTNHFLQRAESDKAKLLSLIFELEPIIERIRSAVFTFLVNAEAELNAGQQAASVFTRAQEYVNGALEKVAPDALQKFISAQERLYSGDPDLSSTRGR